MRFEMRELCFNLLRDWCDGLISLQIRKLGDPTIDGAFHCRACKVFHGRCPDAVYSLVYMYRETRDEKYLEAARAQKKIGKSLEAKVVLYAEGELYDFVSSVKELLPVVLIVSQVEVVNGKGGESSDVAGLGIEVKNADGAKCERCWSFSDTVGQDAEHPTLCARCAQIVK